MKLLIRIDQARWGNAYGCSLKRRYRPRISAIGHGGVEVCEVARNAEGCEEGF